MNDREAIREHWIAERPVYQDLGERIRADLESATRSSGIRCYCDARAKDVSSLLKKIIRRRYSSYEQVHDKAGVRVVAIFEDDIPKIETLIQNRYHIHAHQNKAESLGPDRLGYLGVHFEVSFRNELSHQLLYKAEQDYPIRVQRQVNRLLALIELFDEQVSSARRVIMDTSGFTEGQLLEELERRFYTLTARESDRALSLEIIGTLESLYSTQDLQCFGEVIETFVNSRREKLKFIFEQYQEDERCSPLLFQPESILIFERLEHDPFTLREAWAQTYPLDLLEGLTAIWGDPI